MSLFELPSLTFEPLRYRHHGVGDWSGHIPFARDLIAAVQPALLVELGTHYGESYFTFCQCIREEGGDTRAFAVDTWCGDTHTGRYGEDVFEDVDQYNRANYESFSRLLRMPFDDACAGFSDQSIDLLHIDGLHSYEAVKHDFETWLPKMSPGGVVLIHDIAVQQEGFGAHKYWQELKASYSTFEFFHSCGLGVLRIAAERKLDGILWIMFRPGTDCAPIRRYYETCAESLDCRDAKARPSRWDIVSQLFWRSENEDFGEDRSSRASLTITPSPTLMRLEAALSDAPCELRLDLTNRAMALRVFKLSLLDATGKAVWHKSGDEFFGTMRHAGLVPVRGEGDDSLVIAVGNECSVLVPLADYRTELGSAITLTIELCGVPPDAAIGDLAKRLQATAERDATRAQGQSSTVRQAQEIGRTGSEGYEVALAQAQRLAFERMREAEELSRALASAEALVHERDEHLVRYGAALAEAQRLAMERMREAEELNEAFARAEALVQERDQHLVRYEAALAEAQRLAMERMREAEELNKALARAEARVQERDQHLVQYDAALSEAQRLAAGRAQQLEELSGALARAEALVHERDQHLVQHGAALSEAQRLAAERMREAEELSGALARAEALVHERGRELDRCAAALKETRELAAERARDIEKLTGVMSENRSEFERVQTALRNTELDLEKVRAGLQGMERSLSWRISTPVRTLERLARSFSRRA